MADLPFVVGLEHAGPTTVIDDGDVVVAIVLVKVILQSANESRLLFSWVHDDLNDLVVVDIPDVHVPHQVVLLLVFQVVKTGALPLAEPGPNGIEENDDVSGVVGNFGIWLVAHFFGPPSPAIRHLASGMNLAGTPNCVARRFEKSVCCKFHVC